LNVLNNRVGPDLGLRPETRLLGFVFEKSIRDLNPSLLTEALNNGKKLHAETMFKKCFSPLGFYGMYEVNSNSNQTALLSFQPFICEDKL
jgi:hypothetical protein